MAAFLFSLALLCAYLIDPGYLNWWLTVGITHRISFLIDSFFGFIFLSQSLGPVWVITVLSALVALEVLILNKIRTVEG